MGQRPTGEPRQTPSFSSSRGVWRDVKLTCTLTKAALTQGKTPASESWEKPQFQSSEAHVGRGWRFT